MRRMLSYCVLWVGMLAPLGLPRQAQCEPLDFRLNLPSAQTAARAANTMASPVHLASPGASPAPRLEWVALSAPVELSLPAEAAVLQSGASPEQEHRPRVIRHGELKWLAVGTGVLLATDKTTINWFDPDLNKTPAGDKTGKDISKLGTGLPLGALIVAPALLDGKYGRRTSELTVMAVINTTILTEGIKFLAGRERPFQSNGQVRFHGLSSRFESFPSGHASASFAVAEVIGNRHPRYKLPLYLFATTIAWARMNSAEHFLSDVFVGAAIGIYDGRFVLRHGARLFPW